MRIAQFVCREEWDGAVLLRNHVTLVNVAFVYI